MMNDSLSLRDATVQEIQLELIRRTQFNDLDGEKIYSRLMHYRDLWQAVLLDRPGIPNYSRPAQLLLGGLIKLRDLPDNVWNADQLFVLTYTRAGALQLAQIAKDEEWGGMSQVHEDQEAMDDALGTGRQEFGLLWMWWD
jgi:hypothetical protein